MKQEDKELLLKDLSARLPYGVKVQVEYDAEEFGKTIEIDEITMIDKYGEEILLYHASEYFSIEELKPYLRPLTSMTDEEAKDYIECKYSSGKVIELRRENGCNIGTDIKLMWLDVFDFLNAHHFDYRGLIERGLAIKVTPDNNPYE